MISHLFPGSPAPSAAGDAPQYCRVMFDYEPAHDDELPLKKGDLVRLLNKVRVARVLSKRRANGRTPY